MNFTGIIRTVDRMGRVVIPKEIRNQLKIRDTVDQLEIYMDGDSIVLKKYQPNCIFCGEMENLISYNGKNVCTKCAEELKGKL